MSRTSVSILTLIFSPSTESGPSGNSSQEMILARNASSTSWFTYAIRSAIRTIAPSRVDG